MGIKASVSIFCSFVIHIFSHFNKTEESAILNKLWGMDSVVKTNQVFEKNKVKRKKQVAVLKDKKKAPTMSGAF